MARVTLGSGISSINGSIGGTTFQSGASGTVAKNKGKSSKSTSTKSNYKSTILSIVLQEWSNLSASDRFLWNDYALFRPTTQKNNNGRYLNGQQLFTLYNYSYFYQFGSIISTPSFTTQAVQLPAIRLCNDTSSLLVSVPADIDENDFFMIGKISGQIKPSRNRSIGGTKQMYLEFAVSSAANVTDEYTSVFGAIPAIGSYVEAEFQLFSSTTPNWSNRIKKVFVVETL